MPRATTKPEDPRHILRRHGIRPKKNLGQHFLVNLDAARRIAEHVGGSGTIVEIGPGVGTLTACLLGLGRPVAAVEHDRTMIGLLVQELGDTPGLQILRGDGRSFDFSMIGSGLGVTGNLPYNAGTWIVLNAVDQHRVIDRMVFMLQKEVANRMASPPGKRSYGALSVLVQAFCDVRTIFNLGPGSFYPRPEVDSAVIEIVPRPEPRLGKADPAAFRRVVNAAFGQRRKTLWNALKGSRLWDDGIIARSLKRAGVDPVRRAETLSVEEFASLTLAFANLSNK